MKATAIVWYKTKPRMHTYNGSSLNSTFCEYSCPQLYTAKKSLEDVRRLYFKLKEQVFQGKGLISHYLGFCDSQRLEELLIETFGREMKMTDRTHPK